MPIQDLIHVDANTFVGLDTMTVVPLRGGQGNPMQGRITKKVTGSNVMIFSNKRTNGYERMVRRRLEQEGKNPDDFRLSPRTWGHRLPETPFVEHNDELYLEVIFLSCGTVEYFLDGDQAIAKEAIIGLIEKPEAHQGGLERKVIIRTYSVASIRCIRINGEVHYVNQ